MEPMLELLRLGVGGALAAVGVTLVLGGAIGVLRFPDIYTRLHAAGAESIGVAIVLLGMAVVAPDWGGSARLLLLAGMTAFFGIVRSQILANAAHTGGLAPLAGPYKAPRPGADPERAS